MKVRKANPETDLPGIAAVVEAYDRSPVSLETVHGWFEHNPPGRISERRVVENDLSEVVGYSVVVHENWWEVGVFYAWVGVLPAWRKMSAGNQLYEGVHACLTEQGALKVKSEVRDDDPISLRFAAERGFRVDRHQFASRLDLETFDQAPFSQVIPRLQAEGIRFFSVADAGDTREARRKLHEVNRTTVLDIPGNEGDFLSFEEFESWVCGSHWYDPAGQIIAADGDRWVGMAAVTLKPESQGAYNQMTGVIQEYRGRGIALALKLLGIDYCRERGVRTIKTDNDSTNAPMLAVNRKLGYKPEPGIYWLMKP